MRSDAERFAVVCDWMLASKVSGVELLVAPSVVIELGVTASEVVTLVVCEVLLNACKGLTVATPPRFDIDCMKETIAAPSTKSMLRADITCS